MTRTNVIPLDFQGESVRFDSAGWLHATEIAARFGKVPAEWLRLPETLEYLGALERTYGKIPYVKTSRARVDRGGGTWLHPKLSVAFARWLSPDFAVWCDMQIDALLRGDGGQWQAARRDVTLGHRALCDALALHCKAQGKEVSQRHFVNEARLVNDVLAHVLNGRPRDQLGSKELDLVTLVELRDAALLAAGQDYPQRKASLQDYARQLTASRLPLWGVA